MAGDQRPAESGEYCTCGRSARVVYTGGPFGPTGYCGRQAPPEWGCPWCTEGNHITRCTAYTVRPAAPDLTRYWPAVASWLAEHGRYFPPAPRPRGFRKRRDKLCFNNSMGLVTDPYGDRDLVYAEGSALSEFGWVEHAWTVTTDGAVLDPTWRDPVRARYFGVTVPDRRAFARFVLDNDGYPSLFDGGTIPAFLRDGGVR